MLTLFPTAKSDPDLHPFRAGLIFAFFNALTWQIGIGTPMVLFAEELGATPLQVGLAYSFVFLLTPVQIVSTALLPRHGFKRVALGGWRFRSFFLTVPAVLALLAPAGREWWMAHALVGSVFFFCLFRSIGAAAMTPWFYAFLPARVRGRYFASDQFVSGIAGVGTLVACVALFVWLPIYLALFWQYAIALVGSMLSYYALKRLPDAERPTTISLGTVLRDTPRHMFRPSPFRRYLWLAVGYAVLTTPIPPFAAYYLKVGPQLGAGQIMLFEVLRYCGVILGAWVIGRRIDAAGARPFFLLALVLIAGVAIFWWFFLRNGFGGIPGLFGVYFLVGVAAVCWTVANLHYLPKVTTAADRTLMVSIQGAVTACIGGCSPILWGLLLKETRADGAPAIDVAVFGWFFAMAFVGVCVLSMAIAKLPEASKTSVEPLVLGNAILRPFRAMTYLATLIDIPSLAAPRKREEGTADEEKEEEKQKG